MNPFVLRDDATTTLYQQEHRGPYSLGALGIYTVVKGRFPAEDDYVVRFAWIDRHALMYKCTHSSQLLSLALQSTDVHDGRDPRGGPAHVCARLLQPPRPRAYAWMLWCEVTGGVSVLCSRSSTPVPSSDLPLHDTVSITYRHQAASSCRWRTLGARATRASTST